MSIKKSKFNLPNSSTNELESYHFETEVNQIKDMTYYMKNLSKNTFSKNGLQKLILKNLSIDSENIELTKNQIVDALGYEPVSLDDAISQIIDLIKTDETIKNFINNIDSSEQNSDPNPPVTNCTQNCSS